MCHLEHLSPPIGSTLFCKLEFQTFNSKKSKSDLLVNTNSYFSEDKFMKKLLNGIGFEKDLLKAGGYVR